MKITMYNKRIWKKFYKEKKKYLYCPSPELAAFFSTYMNYDLKDKKILDVGCGAGRNLLLAGKLGAQVYGIDTTEEVIEEAKKFLKREKISFNVRSGEATNIPYSNNYFDVSILWGIFHYLSKNDQKNVKKEIVRVTKNNGWAVFTLRSVHDSRYGIGKEIEKNVFKQNKPGREGIIIQYWNEEQARNFFNLENILIGEKIYAPIGRLEIKSAHWMIAGKINKNG